MSESINTTTKIALLERDTVRILDLMEKIDESIVKITEVSSSLKEMLAVQNNRLEVQESRSDAIERRIDKLDNRIIVLENWKWYITGTLALITFSIPLVVNYFTK